MSSANSLINNQNVRNHPTPDLAIQLKELEGARVPCSRMAYISPSLVKGLGEILSPLMEDDRIPTPFLCPRLESEVRAEWEIGKIKIHANVQPGAGYLHLVTFGDEEISPCGRELYEDYGGLTHEEMTQRIREFFLRVCDKARLLVLARVRFPKCILILDPPLVLSVSSDRLVAENAAANVLAVGATPDQTMEEVKNQVELAWDGDERRRHPQCGALAEMRELREKFVSTIRVVWKSGITE